MADATPTAPKGAGAEGRRLWKAVTDEFDLAAHELLLLRQAARVADACEQLHQLVEAEGPMLGGRVHPAVVELRLQRLVLGRLLVALRVPLAEDEDGDSPRAQRRGVRGFYALPGDVA